MRVRAALLLSLLAATGAVPAARAYSPRVNFQLQCMGCHLADGSGAEGRVPSIRKTLAVFAMTPAGRRYVIRVAGVAQSPLSDADTAILLNWMVRNLSDDPVPECFADFTADEVGRYRHYPLVEVAAERARLLSAPGR